MKTEKEKAPTWGPPGDVSPNSGDPFLRPSEPPESIGNRTTPVIQGVIEGLQVRRTKTSATTTISVWLHDEPGQPVLLFRVPPLDAVQWLQDIGKNVRVTFELVP